MNKNLIKYFILMFILNVSLCSYAHESLNSDLKISDLRLAYAQNTNTSDKYQKKENEQSIKSGNYQTQGYSSSGYDETTDILVPANTVFMASNMSSINSNTITVGENIGFCLNSDFYYKKILIAPEGSIINAIVLDVKRGGGRKYAEIYFKFTNLVTPYGRVIPISAKIKTKDRSGVLRSIISDIINIDENTMFNIILTQPVTVSINNPY